MPDLRRLFQSAALALAIWLGIAAHSPDLFAQSSERYSEPNFEKKLFAREALLLAPQEIAAAVDSLTALASNFPGSEEVDHRLRAKSLAIALRLDGTAPNAIAANRALLKGEQPAAETEFNTLPEVASSLWALADFLETSEKNKDEKVLQFCLVDIAREIDPRNLANSNRYPTRLPQAMFAGWAPIISGGSSEFVFPDNKTKPNPTPEATPDPVVEEPVVPSNPTRTAKGGNRSIGVSGRNAELINIDGDLKAGGGGTQPLAIIFSDDDGDTSQALNEQRETIISALTEIQGSWPNDGGVLVLSISSGHGGDNALSLPATLLTDSLVNERELDPKTAALGIVAPDGSIVPVDKLYQRLKSLPNSDIETILIPAENLSDLQDIALLREFDTLFRFQIILVKTLEQAMSLADAERDENNPGFAKGATAFKVVQDVAKDSVVSEMVGLSIVTKKLAKIIADNPDHASAKVLHDYGAGKLGKTLTRNGSLAALYRATGPVVTAMQSGGSAERAVVLAAFEEVGRIQPILESETRELGKTMSDLLKDIGTYGNFADKSSASAGALKTKIFASWDTVRTEYMRLKNG